MTTITTRLQTPAIPAASRFRRSVETQPAPGTDVVQLSGGAPPTPPPPVAPRPEGLARTGLASKLMAGVGLAAVALSLAGCTGGDGTAPTPPKQEGQTQAQPAASSLTERLGQLKKGDKTAYLNMAEASYYHRVLDTFAQETDPAAADLVKLAQQGNKAWDFNGDPAVQRTNGRDVLTAIVQTPRAEGVGARLQDVARAALKVGEAISGPAGQGAAEGFMTTLKVNGYEQALTELLKRLPEAHQHLQTTTGYDPAIARNYTEGLATTARLGMEAGKELNDPALQAVVLETTVTELYGRVKDDGAAFGGTLQTVLDMAMQLKQRFGG